MENLNHVKVTILLYYFSQHGWSNLLKTIYSVIIIIRGMTNNNNNNEICGRNFRFVGCLPTIRTFFNSVKRTVELGERKYLHFSRGERRRSSFVLFNQIFTLLPIFKFSSTHNFNIYIYIYTHAT